MDEDEKAIRSEVNLNGARGRSQKVSWSVEDIIRSEKKKGLDDEDGLCLNSIACHGSRTKQTYHRFITIFFVGRAIHKGTQPPRA